MDRTENARREMQAEFNSAAASKTPEELRADLESQYGIGNVWTIGELTRDFEVTGFLAPFAGVRRKSDGKKGSVAFAHSPRFYFDFRAE